MPYVKRFVEWTTLKIRLNEIKQNPPLVKERDLWWISFGENIGNEINGKHDLFSRPGLILKKLGRFLFLVAPSTTQPKVGSWYVKILYGQKEMFICLHQIRIIDYRRLSSRLGQVDDDDFKKVKLAFEVLYK